MAKPKGDVFNPCIYNSGVECDVRFCCLCGWHPEVDQFRRKQLEKFGRIIMLVPKPVYSDSGNSNSGGGKSEGVCN